MNRFFTGWNIRKLGFVLIVVVFCFFPLQQSIAADDCTATFSWLDSNSSTVKGYKLYYGQTAGTYTGSFDAGKPEPDTDGRIRVIVTGLTCGQQYYFAGVSYNNDDVESGYSIEVAVTPTEVVSGSPIAGEVPGSPTNLIVIE